MYKEPVPCQLTVMVMVRNRQNQLLTVDRVKSWQGVTFPGGHLEPGESVLDCARREVLEETGQVIENLTPAGLIHWFNRDDGQRYFVHCFRADTRGGPLKDSAEGPCAWLTLDDLFKAKLSPGFKEQLRLFTDDDLVEAFGTFGASGDSPLNYDDGGKVQS